MFQGNEYQRNHDLLDELRPIATQLNTTLAALVVAWTIAQPGITSALCGAKRDWQIQQSAAAAHLVLSTDVLQQINTALQRRGTPLTKTAV
jgi:aryl-alcohol dehydrogenase-like predicted oxidoreductase